MSDEIKNSLENYFDQVEAFLDSFIENGNEQELFVSSYLHGHFSVVAAGVLLSEQQMIMFTNNADDNKVCRSTHYQDVLKNLLSKSINTAIANLELSNEDAVQVRQLVEKIPTYTV